jgi:uridylate kinase
MPEPKYKRVLIKISGEAIAGSGSEVLGFDVMGRICDVIKRCLGLGVQIGIVVGGGNIWRGAKDGADKMDRSRADHMGMLATTINALALADVLEARDVVVRVQTAVEMRAFAEPYVRLRAIAHLEKGRVVIFGCGTGNPFFSTDTAAVLRGAEIEANIVLLAKNVDGVYTDDPKKNPLAKRYDELTPGDFLRDNLAAMDAAAVSLARDNNMPVLLFALSDPENIYRAVLGEKVGTLVRKGG